MATKAEQVEAARLAQLRAFVPGLFRPGTLLYVGASPARSQFLPELLAARRQVTILEIWPAYADHFRVRRDLAVVCGDVRDVEGLGLPHGVYDAAFWWHGPEHVPRADLERAVAGLEARARLVVIGAPWGRSPQGPVDGNDHQRHVATLWPGDFTALGYRVSTYGRPGGGSRSNILAVKP